MVVPVWIVAAAAALGARHAFAPDHLSAVGTYVEKTQASRRQGLMWALRIAAGHSIGMLAIAAAIEIFLLKLSPAWMTATTWASSLWLMIMAVLVFWDLILDVRKRRYPNPAHPSEGSGGTSRLQALIDKWFHRPVTGWFVGLIFGVAVAPGDLAIFTMMIRYNAQPAAAFGLLFVFLAAMFAGLAVVGSGLGWANSRAFLRRGFQALSGLAGMAVGVALVTGLLH